MTLYELQDNLVEQLKILFDGYRLINAKKETAKINIYPQSLPVKKGQNDTSHFPFILVSVEEIDIESRNADEQNLIYLLFGNYDMNENMQGHKDIINMITKTKDYMISTHLISGKFELDYPIRCVFQKENTFPAFYGGMELTFKIPSAGANQYIDENMTEFSSMEIAKKVEDLI